MAQALKDLNVALLAVDGFEQSELLEPKRAITEAGARAVVISARREPIQGMAHDEKGQMVDVDLTFAEADPAHFDAVVLPGGVVNADEIRLHPQAQAFVKHMNAQNKPIAVICHGAWLLVSANLVAGRQLTSFPSLQDDLRNAGAKWVDQEVVVDGNLVSSRRPDDLPAFNQAFLKLLGATRTA